MIPAQVAALVEIKQGVCSPRARVHAGMQAVPVTTHDNTGATGQPWEDHIYIHRHHPASEQT